MPSRTLRPENLCPFGHDQGIANSRRTGNAGAKSRYDTHHVTAACAVNATRCSPPHPKGMVTTP